MLSHFLLLVENGSILIYVSLSKLHLNSNIKLLQARIKALKTILNNLAFMIENQHIYKYISH
ncbi:hypothetical protein Riv7116_1474 [Rivularia sp. PCC 7116]|nr:hypothetical protein Riv7116_1474 [Rivularia sp. PCC 7116]